jgi:hypothetical protein
LLGEYKREYYYWEFIKFFLKISILTSVIVLQDKFDLKAIAVTTLLSAYG